MANNEPMPGHLTVRRLRAMLEDADDGAIVALLLHETVEVPKPLNFVLANLRVANTAGPVVKLELCVDLNVPATEPSE